MPTLDLKEGAAGANYDGTVLQISPTFAGGGTAGSFYTGNVESNVRHGLLLFDVSSIAGGTVTSATLYICIITTYPYDRGFAVHSILAANSGWAEDANWDYADGASASVRWAGDTGNDGGSDAGCSVSGTDYNASALGTGTYTANDPAGTAIAFALNVAQVQAWVDGSNYGLLLRATDPTQNPELITSDNEPAANRPRLVIEYTSGAATGAPVYAYAQQ